MFTVFCLSSVDILTPILVAPQWEYLADSGTQLCMYSEHQICVYAVDAIVFEVRK